MDWLNYIAIFIAVFVGWFGWLIYIAPTPVNEPDEHKFDDAAFDTIRDELDRQEGRTRKVRCVS